MTKEQIKKSKKYSPGLIGGEIVAFLPSEKNTFFLKHDGQENFLKDENGKFVKMDIENVVDARFLYLTTFEEKEKQDAVNSEFESLKRKLQEKANEIINKINQYENWVNGKWHSLNSTDTTMAVIVEHLYAQQGTNIKEQNKIAGQMFFTQNPTALEMREKLKTLLENEDYDYLDHLLNFEFWKPLATFKNGEDVDFTAFVNLFGAKNIMNTIDENATKGSLYLKAKINVEKSYFPEC